MENMGLNDFLSSIPDSVLVFGSEEDEIGSFSNPAERARAIIERDRYEYEKILKKR